MEKGEEQGNFSFKPGLLLTHKRLDKCFKIAYSQQDDGKYLVEEFMIKSSILDLADHYSESPSKFREVFNDSYNVATKREVQEIRELIEKGKTFLGPNFYGSRLKENPSILHNNLKINSIEDKVLEKE